MNQILPERLHASLLGKLYGSERRTDGRDELEQEAREQILTALADGSELDCGGYTLDRDDFGIFLGERHDFPAIVHAFHVAKTMPLVDFLAYLNKQEENYADLHAGARADAMEQAGADYAEYSRGDR